MVRQGYEFLSKLRSHSSVVDVEPIFKFGCNILSWKIEQQF